jgi:hypothetical protein
VWHARLCCCTRGVGCCYCCRQCCRVRFCMLCNGQQCGAMLGHRIHSSEAWLCLRATKQHDPALQR